jgi:hypothetical protein
VSLVFGHDFAKRSNSPSGLKSAALVSSTLHFGGSAHRKRQTAGGTWWLAKDLPCD